jgi:hypothetical protein
VEASFTSLPKYFWAFKSPPRFAVSAGTSGHGAKVAQPPTSSTLYEQQQQPPLLLP